MDTATKNEIAELREETQALRERVDRSYTLLYETISPSGGPTAPLDVAFVTIGNDERLSDERAVAAGWGIELTDGGAGASITFAVKSSDLDAVYLSNPMTEDLDMGTYAITNVGDVDGVDVSALKASYDTHIANDDAHHTAFIGLDGDTGSASPDGSDKIGVEGGDGIVTSATGTTLTVAVDLATTSGLAFSSGELEVADTIAGAGLAISTKILAVGAGNGISVAADAVAVNQAYAFTWTNNHTFDTDKKLYFRDTNTYIYSPSSGELSLYATTAVQLITGSLIFGAISNATISNPSGYISIEPDSYLYFDAPSGVIYQNWASGRAIESDTYVSQTTGWAISYGSNGGDADFRYIYSDELHVQAFIADIYQAVVGGLIVTKSRARISRNFSIPSNGNTGTLYLEDLEGWPNIAVFASGDYVRLRYIDTSGGGLIVTDVWGTVTSYTDLTGGEQSWTFTTSDDGGVSGSDIYAGSIALDYGQSGGASRGVWEATVLDSAGAPYSQVSSWATNPWTPGNFTTHVRLGNLDGISGIGLEYGLWAGQGTANDDPQVIVSDSQATFRNLDLVIHDGTNEVIVLDVDTPYLSVGANAPTGYSTGNGFWVGETGSGDYKLRIGDATGQRLTWDGASVTIYNSAGDEAIQATASGNVDIAGVLDIGTDGGIWQGSGTFASPTTGLKIWNDSGVGRIAGYNSSTEQWYADTDGRLYAGGGVVRLDSAGVKVKTTTAYQTINSYQFTDSTFATTVARFSAYYNSVGGELGASIIVGASSTTANFGISVDSTSSGGSTLEIELDDSVGSNALIEGASGSTPYWYLYPRVGVNTYPTSYTFEVDGNASFTEYIYHDGDSDTYMRFQADRITLRAGGIDMLDLVEGATDYLESDANEFRMSATGTVGIKLTSTDHTSTFIQFNRSGSSYSDWKIFQAGGYLRFASAVDETTFTTHFQLLSTGTYVQNAFFLNGLGSATTGTDLIITASNEVRPKSSSSRFKENIVDLSLSENVVMELRPRTFDYKDGTKHTHGFIADELFQVLPDAVNLDADGRPFSNRNDVIIAVLTAKVQQLEKRVRELEAA